MFAQFLTSWWAMVSAFFAAPSLLLAGKIHLLTVLPVVGMLLVAIGVVLAIVWREKHGFWLVPPFIATALTPIVIGLANSIMGWFAVLFTICVGTVGMLLWISMIAHDASRRLPIWLFGYGLLCFVLYCGYLSIAMIWGVG